MTLLGQYAVSPSKQLNSAEFSSNTAAANNTATIILFSQHLYLNDFLLLTMCLGYQEKSECLLMQNTSNAKCFPSTLCSAQTDLSTGVLISFPVIESLT